MLCEVVSSARCNACRLETPVLIMSAIVQLLRRYRRIVDGLERRHTGGNRQPLRDGYDLVGVLGIRGVAAALQRGGEGAHVRAGAERRGEARVVAQHTNIVGDAVRYIPVGAK